MFIGERADEHIAAFDSHDVALQPFDNHRSCILSVNDAAIAVKESHILTYSLVPITSGISDATIRHRIIIRRRNMLLHGTVTAKVRPSQISLNDINLIGLLHHGVVNGDLLTGRKQFLDGLILRTSPERRGYPVHDFSDPRSVGTHLGDNGSGTPDEYPGVPKVCACGKIFLGGDKVRLFLELPHLDDLLRTFLFREYVPVACLRTCRFDADGHNPIAFGGEIQRLADYIRKFLFI